MQSFYKTLQAKQKTMDEIKPFETEINKSDYTVLIVDDVVSNVLLLKTLLKNEKYGVLTANNGRVCIDMCKEHHPDLILLDVMMPDINGYDTAVILKKDPNLKDIPIIFLTALNNPSDLVRGFQVGANDFLTKPFNKEELLMRVSHQISLVAAKRIIEKQNEELRTTMANRDRMYSVIAHDLRSPLGSIQMALMGLLQNVDPKAMGEIFYEMVDQAHKETEELFDLLDNLLKWTKSQTGRLNVVFQNFELDPVLLGIVEMFERIASSKNIKLTYEPSDKQYVVHADNDMLKTVLRNFLSNAIKFSNENSSIELIVSEKDNCVKIGIRDHGVGIKAERLNTIFSKGSTTYGTNKEEGSGLGLQLCKDFAVKFGGDVEVESVEGEGSTFSVLVPLTNEEI